MMAQRLLPRPAAGINVASGLLLILCSTLPFDVSSSTPGVCSAPNYYFDVTVSTDLWLLWNSSSGRSGRIEYQPGLMGAAVPDENGTGGMRRRVVLFESETGENCRPYPNVTTSFRGQMANVTYRDRFVVIANALSGRACNSIYGFRNAQAAGVAGTITLFVGGGRPVQPGATREQAAREPPITFPTAGVTRERNGTHGALPMLQEIMAGHVVELFWPGTGRIAPEERAALKDFYTHTLVGVHELMGIFGEHNTTLSRAQFLADDLLDPCGGRGGSRARLVGVTCVGGHVVDISFPIWLTAKLAPGSWPSSMGQLSHLRSLKIYTNTPGKPGVMSLPDTAHNWTQLRSFAWCAISAAPEQLLRLPTTMSSLASLTYLELHGIAHSGPFPSAMFTIPAMSSIIIDTMTVDTLPTVSSMTSLEMFHMPKTGVRGALPSFAGLSKLKSVQLQGNVLTGGDASAFDNCSSLITLNLGSNALSSELFTLRNCPNLEMIMLGRNSPGLTGAIPAQWANLGNAKVIDISHNALGGVDQSDIGAFRLMKSLVKLDMDHNQFEMVRANPANDVPFTDFVQFARYFMPPSLKFVDMSNNHYTTQPGFALGLGGMPPPGLVSWKMSHNQFRGLVLFENIGFNLDLSFNNITGVKHTDRIAQSGSPEQHVEILSIRLDHQTVAEGDKVGFIREYSPGQQEVYEDIDEALTEMSFQKVSQIPSPTEFAKVEWPTGSKLYPFSCPVFHARDFPNLVFAWDPAFYGYHGGSSATLRRRWLLPSDDTDYKHAFETAFGGEDGFCRCEPGHYGNPPNCLRFASHFSRSATSGSITDVTFGDGRTKDGLDTAWHVRPDPDSGYKSHTLVFDHSALVSTDLLVVYAGANKTNERILSFSIRDPPVIGQEYHVVAPDFLLHYISGDTSGFHFNVSWTSSTKLPCVRGTYRAPSIVSTATASCSPCAAGTYSDIIGATSCKSCEKGLRSVSGGAVCTASCPIFTRNHGAAACDLCPPGLAQEGVDGSRYFWRDGRCKKCPSSMAPTVLLLLVIVFAGVGIAHWAMETHMDYVHVLLTAVGTVLVHTLQVVVIVSERVPWPPAIADILDLLQKLALRLDLASPECIATFNEPTKAAVMLFGMPIFIFVASFVYSAGRRAMSSTRGQPTPTGWAHCTRVTMVCLYWLYVSFASVCWSWAVCENGHLTTNEDIQCWTLIEDNQLSTWGKLLLIGLAAAPFLHVLMPLNIYRALSGGGIGCCMPQDTHMRNAMACISAPYKLRWQRRWVMFDMAYKTSLVWGRIIGSFEQRSQTMALLILVCAYHVSLCIVQPFKLDVINSQDGALFSIFLICGAAQVGLLAGTLTYLKKPAGESTSVFEQDSMEAIVMFTLLMWLSACGIVLLWRIATSILLWYRAKRGHLSSVERAVKKASENEFQAKMLHFQVAREEAHLRRVRNRKIAAIAPLLLLFMGILCAMYSHQSGSAHQAAASAFMLAGATAIFIRARFFFRWLGAIFESQQRLEDGASIAFMMQSAKWYPGDEHWVMRGKGQEDMQFEQADHRRHWRRGTVEKVEKAPGGGGRSMLQVRLEDDNSIVTVRHAPGLIELPRTAKGFMHRGQEWLRRIPMSRITEAVLGGVAGSPDLFRLSEPCDPQQIDFFISHSWHDDVEQKYHKLSAFAAEFKRKHGREPTFWLDKCCLDQENITQGLQVLAVFLMACRSVIVLGGVTYTSRLWCMWELYVYFAFRPHARIDVLSLDGEGSSRLEDELRYFTVANAFCFDPNEEKRIMDAISAGRGGTASFNKIIQELGSRVLELSGSASDLGRSRGNGRSIMPLPGQEGTLMQVQHGREAVRAAARVEHAMTLMMSLDGDERAKGADIMQKLQSDLVAQANAQGIAGPRRRRSAPPVTAMARPVAIAHATCTAHEANSESYTTQTRPAETARTMKRTKSGRIVHL